MIPLKKPFVIGVVAAVAVTAAVGAAVLTARRAHQMTHAVYYCPMHPSYTSNRPGDCPICNMKLVKQETVSSASTGHDHSQQAETICLLHNCAKLHQGQPCPMTVVAKPGEKVTCPICGAYIADTSGGTLRKILYWTDPMIPGYRSETPGKSPMGMDLVPVYAEEGAPAGGGAAPDGYAPVLLTPQKQQFIGVTTAPARRQHLTKNIRTVGTIAHDPELYQAQAEYIQAIKARDQARSTGAHDAIEQAQRIVEASRIRLKHLGLSDELIQEMEAWSEPQHSLLFAHPGEPVWMYAQIYEYELPLVRVGQAVTVQVPAQTEPLHGTIRAIDQMIEPMTRTVRIRALLSDPQGQLKPDMYVNVEIAMDQGEVLAIPESAVFATGEKQIVFVDKGEGLFEPRDVAVGVKADGYYEIKSGVAEGELVVTSGNFLIDSESRLKAALGGMTGEGHQHGGQ